MVSDTIQTNLDERIRANIKSNFIYTKNYLNSEIDVFESLVRDNWAYRATYETIRQLPDRIRNVINDHLTVPNYRNPDNRSEDDLQTLYKSRIEYLKMFIEELDTIGFKYKGHTEGPRAELCGVLSKLSARAKDTLEMKV